MSNCGLSCPTPANQQYCTRPFIAPAGITGLGAAYAGVTGTVLVVAVGTVFGDITNIATSLSSYYQVIGGALCPPYFWSVRGTDNLAAHGLTLLPSGVLSGTVTNLTDELPVVTRVRATDCKGCHVDGTISLVVVTD